MVGKGEGLLQSHTVRGQRPGHREELSTFDKTSVDADAVSSWASTWTEVLRRPAGDESRGGMARPSTPHNAAVGSVPSPARDEGHSLRRIVCAVLLFLGQLE